MTHVVSSYRTLDYIVQVLHKAGGYTWQAYGRHGDRITSKLTWRRFEDAVNNSADVMGWSTRKDDSSVSYKEEC